MIRKKTALEPCSRCPELVLENRAGEFRPMSAAARFPFPSLIRTLTLGVAVYLGGNRTQHYLINTMLPLTRRQV
jgi:hypothetical protein